MITDQQSHLAFHLTGALTGGALHAVDGRKLVPALLAGYRDLTGLRYDFPAVLLRDDANQPFASLSDVIEELISKLASAGEDEPRVRKQLLRLEREIRSVVAAGSAGTLSSLWEHAATRLVPSSDHPLAQTFARARAALARDGELVDCNAAFPTQALLSAWRHVENARARRMRTEIERLKFRLWEILQAALMSSERGRETASLKVSVGKSFESAFDFDALSATLASARRAGGLSATRRERIENALIVLEQQRFYPARQKDAFPFSFTSCTEAEAAWRERLPKVIELSKAMAIAELEIKGEYNELRHDPLFAAYGARGLPRDEIARFPSYLVCMHATAADQYGELMTLLGAGVPVKALVQFDDLLENGAQLRPQAALSMRSKQLADMAIGLGTVFVMQSAASNLVRSRERVLNGLAYDGPSLFSIYSGASAGAVPAYLRAAAAMEARVFPAFTYDPAAGRNWATRFSIADNPQAERDWPAQALVYEDREHQKVEGAVDFTLIDFAALDERYATHFASVPAAQWNGHMAPVQAWLVDDAAPPADSVPYITMVDQQDVLQRVIVDASVIEEARRCRTVWHSLQELGGIHNSHAERLLAEQRAAWEQEKARNAGTATVDASVATSANAATAPGSSVEATPAIASEERPADDPYIETPRCTTCEECVRINNKMFMYDANKQAYIADVKAGTYRQLVEAAESCQVSIIHPGKPRNAEEPGLAELVERAQPFM